MWHHLFLLYVLDKCISAPVHIQAVMVINGGKWTWVEPGTSTRSSSTTDEIAAKIESMEQRSAEINYSCVTVRGQTFIIHEYSVKQFQIFLNFLVNRTAREYR